jgi:ElaB/YqjD/DUF883 family membrane-anchored ribosome-binding protein
MATNCSQESKKDAPGIKASVALAANEAKDTVRELAASVAHKVEEVASDVTTKAQDWAANVANKAQETATAAVDKTNDGIAAVGQRISALGGKVREAAPKNGVVGSAATTVAEELEAGGHYLEGHGIADMGKDLTQLVRRYPVQSILAGFAVGCLVGVTLSRTLRRS